MRQEIQDSLCVWTRPGETGALRGKQNLSLEILLSQEAPAYHVSGHLFVLLAGAIAAALSCTPVAGDEKPATNSLFFRERQRRSVRTKDRACLFQRSHPWERMTRWPCLSGDPPPPLSQQCNWGDGGALGQSRGLRSGEELLRQQHVLVGVYSPPSCGPCAGTALAPPCPAFAKGAWPRGIGTTLGGWLRPTHPHDGSKIRAPQHPFLCFLSILNASLPCVGARQQERGKNCGWDF